MITDLPDKQTILNQALYIHIGLLPTIATLSNTYLGISCGITKKSEIANVPGPQQGKE